MTRGIRPRLRYSAVVGTRTVPSSTADDRRVFSGMRDHAIARVKELELVEPVARRATA